MALVMDPLLGRIASIGVLESEDRARVSDKCVVPAESNGNGGKGCRIKGFWPLMLTAPPSRVRIFMVDDTTWDSL